MILSQYLQKVIMWSGILEDPIISAPIYRRKFKCRNVCGHARKPLIEFENQRVADSNLYLNLLHFLHQDGALPHLFPFRQWLHNNYPNQRIRRDSVEWPSRFPDLSPLDFFL